MRVGLPASGSLSSSLTIVVGWWGGADPNNTDSCTIRTLQYGDIFLPHTYWYTVDYLSIYLSTAAARTKKCSVLCGWEPVRYSTPEPVSSLSLERRRLPPHAPVAIIHTLLYLGLFLPTHFAYAFLDFLVPCSIQYVSL
jgi:hypothetical protein